VGRINSVLTARGGGPLRRELTSTWEFNGGRKSIMPKKRFNPLIAREFSPRGKSIGNGKKCRRSSEVGDSGTSCKKKIKRKGKRTCAFGQADSHYKKEKE